MNLSKFNLHTVYLILIFSLILVDQITKYLFENVEFDFGFFISILSKENFGSAFSLFSGILLYPYFVIILSIIVLIIFFRYLDYFKQTKILTYSFIFIVSGILGNLIDRIIFLHVRDFLYLKGFFIFNLADLYLTIGIVLLVISKISENKTLKN